MGTASYVALAQRKREWNLSVTTITSIVMGILCLILAARWRFVPSAQSFGPFGSAYPTLYLFMAFVSFAALCLLKWRPLSWIPLAFPVVILLFASVLTWIDLHSTDQFVPYLVAVFAMGAIFSTGPAGYALLLGGSFLFLVALTTLTLPGQLVRADFLDLAIAVGLAFVGCVLLENQRRKTDEAAVGLEDLNEQLRETSFRDPLTNLYNRRFFGEFLAGKRALAVRMSMPLSVVLIDIDHFKKVNDNLGHAVGDMVLKGLSHALVEGVRESDLVARYGGEEFVLILPQAVVQNAARVTVRILERVRKASFPGVPWQITFSAGVAALEPGETIEALLERADRRLYEAKRRRNLVVSW